MKTILLILYLFLFASHASTAIWDQGAAPFGHAGRATRYSLNQAEIIFSNGLAVQSLGEFERKFRADSQARKAHHFSSQVLGRLIACALDPLTRTAKALEHVSAQCVFARARKDRVRYQRVTLNGFPVLNDARLISFAGLVLEVSAQDHPLHLIPRQEPFLETLAIKHAAGRGHDLESLRARFLRHGWAEFDIPGEKSFYLHRARESVLAHEENDRVVLVHAREK